ncbi:MAG: polysaccharide deacetylase family protein, partial [Proteobacteria bacterium]|nr:polysaccharide deacetylase family protein [Pseudomonadota bacterium]
MYQFGRQFFGSEISRGSIFRKEIALTFDGGGKGKSFTGEILDLLSAEGVAISAFLTGTFMAHHRDDTKLLHEYGAEIGNHSMTHPWLAQGDTWRTSPGMSRETFLQEIVTTEDLYRSITGASLAPFWRAPYGARSQEVLNWGSDHGLTHVYWTHDTADWRTDIADPLSRPGSEIIARLMRYEAEAPHGLQGAIILLHVGARREIDPLYPHLRDFCKDLRGKGYSFVPISALAANAAEAAMAGDLEPPRTAQLPISSGFELVGLVEDVFDDGWIGPRFSARLRSTASQEKIGLSLHLPDIFSEQEVSLFINGQKETVARLAPNQTITLEGA